MIVSFRAHILSGVLNLITFCLTCVALFTCYWLNFGTLVALSNYSHLPVFGVSGCFYLSTSWSTATAVFMFIAFFFQLMMGIYLLLSMFNSRFNEHVLKVDSSLIGGSTLCLLIAIIIYGIGYATAGNLSSVANLDYSYILACIATFVSFIAGIPVGHAYKKIKHCGDCECSYFDTW